MDVPTATAAYADYLSGLSFAREFFNAESLLEYEEDLAKAKAEMERAWIDSSVSKEI